MLFSGLFNSTFQKWCLNVSDIRMLLSLLLKTTFQKRFPNLLKTRMLFSLLSRQVSENITRWYLTWPFGLESECKLPIGRAPLSIAFSFFLCRESYGSGHGMETRQLSRQEGPRQVPSGHDRYHRATIGTSGVRSGGVRLGPVSEFSCSGCCVALGRPAQVGGGPGRWWRCWRIDRSAVWGFAKDPGVVWGSLRDGDRPLPGNEALIGAAELQTAQCAHSTMQGRLHEHSKSPHRRA